MHKAESWNAKKDLIALMALQLKESRSQGIKEQANESYQNSYTTSKSRLTGYFCSETIFNLSHRVLTDAEIKLLEKDWILLLYNGR